MATTVIDELVTIIRYNTSNRELRRAEQQVKDFTGNTQRQFASWGQNISKITRAATVVIGALGAGAFKVGAAEERSFLNLQTQLGDTAEKVNELKGVARSISKETNKPLRELGDALFSIRSGGQKGAAGLDILNQSAKAAAAGLGETRPIGLLAASAINSYGEAALSGSDAVDKILAIVESGNLDASTLAEPMTQLLSPGASLGVTFDELGASVAGYTRITGNASRAITGVYQALNALLKPTKEAETSINGVYGSIQNMHKAIREDGFFNVLQRLHGAVDGDVVAMGRMFSSTEALGFVLDATSLNAAAYAESLENINNSVGKVNNGFDIYANSSVADADRATNNLRLALSTLYNNVLAPLLQLFGKLPSAIQTVVLGMGAMQIASTIGLGPSVGGLVTSLWRFIVALKTGTIWQSQFVLSLKATRIGMLLTGATARVMWASITGPIGIAVALIGILVFKFRHQIVGALKFAWNWIKGNWPLLVGILLGPFGIVGALVWKFRDDIVDALMGVWNWAKGNWPLLVGILFGPFGIAAGLIFKFRDDIVDAIMWIKDQSTSIFTALRDFVIGIWQGVGAAIGGAFRGVINAVISGLNKALDAASSFVEAIKGALDKAPFGNPLGDFLLGVASKLRAGIPNFAIGGIVPGPLGRPLLATVHGGEMVLPVGASRVLAQMLKGFQLGPSALPQAPPGYGQMYRSSVTNRTVNININEPIVIQTQATDAKGIAQELGEAIQDQIRNIAYDHDGPVER